MKGNFFFIYLPSQGGKPDKKHAKLLRKKRFKIPQFQHPPAPIIIHSSPLLTYFSLSPFPHPVSLSRPRPPPPLSSSPASCLLLYTPFRPCVLMGVSPLHPKPFSLLYHLCLSFSSPPPTHCYLCYTWEDMLVLKSQSKVTVNKYKKLYFVEKVIFIWHICFWYH